MNKEIVFVEEQKRGRKRIEITETDLLMMIVIEKVGFLAIETFVKYADLKSRTVQGRFTKLMEFGYLSREREGLYFPYQYFLTQKGMNFVFEHFYLGWMSADDDYVRKAPRKQIKNARHQNLVGGLILYLVRHHPSMAPLEALEHVLSERDIQWVRYWEKNKEIIHPIHHWWPVHSGFPKSGPIEDVVWLEHDLSISFEIELYYKGRDRTEKKMRNNFVKDHVIWIVPENKKALIEFLEEERYRTKYHTNWRYLFLKMKDDDLIAPMDEYMEIMAETREQNRLAAIDLTIYHEKVEVFKQWLTAMNPVFHLINTKDYQWKKDYLLKEMKNKVTIFPKQMFDDLIRNAIRIRQEGIKAEQERIKNSKGSLLNKEQRQRHKHTVESSKNEIARYEQELDKLKSVNLSDIEI